MIKQEKNYKYPTKKEIRDSIDKLWNQEDMKDLLEVLKDIDND